ncbi:MAG: bacteriocin [Sphingobacteriaceae bacterium]|jgi:bacteriocin-like protein|nr:bacteriocin [Sphingobacteriaceae bacterium]
MKNKRLQKLDISLNVLSTNEMQQINGGMAEQPKSVFYYAGYYVGKFIGLASWAGVGISRSN